MITRFMAALLFAIGFAGQSAHAEGGGSKLDEIVAKGVLRVGTTGDYKPFTYHDAATNTFEGFDIDLAQNLGEALGVKVEFVKTSWSTLMKDFGDGKFDVGFGGISYSFDARKKLISRPHTCVRARRRSRGARTPPSIKPSPTSINRASEWS